MLSKFSCKGQGDAFEICVAYQVIQTVAQKFKNQTKMAFIHESALVFYNMIDLKTTFIYRFFYMINTTNLFRILVHFCCHLFKELYFNLSLIIELSIIFYNFSSILDCA